MSNFQNRESKGMAEPPGGAVVGENVPLENQLDKFDEQSIQECIGIMKTRGEPYTQMKEYELRERAKQILNL